MRRCGSVLVLCRYLGEDFSIIDQGTRRLRVDRGKQHVLH